MEVLAVYFCRVDSMRQFEHKVKSWESNLRMYDADVQTYVYRGTYRIRKDTFMGFEVLIHDHIPINSLILSKVVESSN